MPSQLPSTDGAAVAVAEGGLRWIAGADGVPQEDWPAFAGLLRLEAIHRAQAGNLADMDRIADALYER